MPGGLGHGTPLFALVADLIQTLASAGERCVTAALVGPADHAYTSEMRDRGIGSDAHTAADSKPVDENDSASLAEREGARSPSGWQLKGPGRLEDLRGGPCPLLRGRGGALHNKQHRRRGNHGAAETQSRQSHHLSYVRIGIEVLAQGSFRNTAPVERLAFGTLAWQWFSELRRVPIKTAWADVGQPGSSSLLVWRR